MDNTNVNANSRPPGVLFLINGHFPASSQRRYHAGEAYPAPKL
jgi:hypothetical protein